MKFNVSISDSLAYVRDDALPDKSEEAKAIYPTIQRALKVSGRKTEDLAKRLDIKVDTLRQKLNVNNDSHNFHPHQLMLLMREIGDVSILEAMAGFLGYVVQPDRRSFDGDMLDAMTELHSVSAELFRQIADLHREKVKGRIEYATANDVNRVYYHAQEVQHALMGVLRAADAMRRPAPEV